MEQKQYWAEYGSAALIFLGFVANAKQLSLGDFLLILGALGLVIIYLSRAAVPHLLMPNAPESARQSVLSRVAYMAFSALVWAASFKLLLMPYIHRPMRIALIVMVLVMLGILFQLRLALLVPVAEFYRYLLIRLLLIASISFMFFLTPYERLARLYYQDKDYAKIYGDYLDKPKDAKLRKAWEEAKAKR